ncbi:MAG: sodium:proton antiporter NhaD [Muribaculaceae bacterium]|nr:sodium:proton antiporter NhaD [Muribaculaceae bacterium]
MITAMIVVFVIGYVLIALEHPLHINKATFALLTCVIMWSIYALMGDNPDIHHGIVTQLGDTCEIVVFLIGAMTIVEIIDRYGGFSFITENIHAKSKRHLLWILCILSFIMSAVLDNMTTTIIMVMMLRRLLSDQKDRWLFAGLIVIAANAGGAFSPIGDVTTIMLWMDEKVSSVGLIINLLIPSIAAMVIPVFIAQYFIKEGKMQTLTTMADKNPGLHERHPHLSKAMLVIGISGLLFVPIFKTVTGLPPFMGIMLSLGVIWGVTEIWVKRFKIDSKMGGRVSSALHTIDMPTILFFLGILMAVSALSEVGALTTLADEMNTKIHQPVLMTSIIGILSSIVDNVPLVSACIKMFEGMAPAGTVDPYLLTFVEDGLFWHLLTFCAGVGGSLLIIGSAAGVVAMGIEKIPFFWYVKKITLLALAGYIAGILIICLESLFPFFLQTAG